MKPPLIAASSGLPGEKEKPKPEDRYGPVEFLGVDPIRVDPQIVATNYGVGYRVPKEYRIAAEREALFRCAAVNSTIDNAGRAFFWQTGFDTLIEMAKMHEADHVYLGNCMKFYLAQTPHVVQRNKIEQFFLEMMKNKALGSVRVIIFDQFYATRRSQGEVDKVYEFFKDNLALFASVNIYDSSAFFELLKKDPKGNDVRMAFVKLLYERYKKDPKSVDVEPLIIIESYIFDYLWCYMGDKDAAEALKDELKPFDLTSREYTGVFEQEIPLIRPNFLEASDGSDAAEKIEKRRERVQKKVQDTMRQSDNKSSIGTMVDMAVEAAKDEGVIWIQYRNDLLRAIRILYESEGVEAVCVFARALFQEELEETIVLPVEVRKPLEALCLQNETTAERKVIYAHSVLDKAQGRHFPCVVRDALAAAAQIPLNRVTREVGEIDEDSDYVVDDCLPDILKSVGAALPRLKKDASYQACVTSFLPAAFFHLKKEKRPNLPTGVIKIVEGFNAQQPTYETNALLVAAQLQGAPNPTAIRSMWEKMALCQPQNLFAIEAIEELYMDSLVACTSMGRYEEVLAIIAVHERGGAMPECVVPHYVRALLRAPSSTRAHFDEATVLLEQYPLLQEQFAKDCEAARKRLGIPIATPRPYHALLSDAGRWESFFKGRQIQDEVWRVTVLRKLHDAQEFFSTLLPEIVDRFDHGDQPTDSEFTTALRVKALRVAASDGGGFVATLECGVGEEDAHTRDSFTIAYDAAFKRSQRSTDEQNPLVAFSAILLDIYIYETLSLRSGEPIGALDEALTPRAAELTQTHAFLATQRALQQIDAASEYQSENAKVLMRLAQELEKHIAEHPVPPSDVLTSLILKYYELVETHRMIDDPLHYYQVDVAAVGPLGAVLEKVVIHNRLTTAREAQAFGVTLDASSPDNFSGFYELHLKIPEQGTQVVKAFLDEKGNLMLPGMGGDYAFSSLIWMTLLQALAQRTVPSLEPYFAYIARGNTEAGGSQTPRLRGATLPAAETDLQGLKSDCCGRIVVSHIQKSADQNPATPRDTTAQLALLSSIETAFASIDLSQVELLKWPLVFKTGFKVTAAEGLLRQSPDGAVEIDAHLLSTLLNELPDETQPQWVTFSNLGARERDAFIKGVRVRYRSGSIYNLPIKLSPVVEGTQDPTSEIQTIQLGNTSYRITPHSMGAEAHEAFTRDFSRKANIALQTRGCFVALYDSDAGEVVSVMRLGDAQAHNPHIARYKALRATADTTVTNGMWPTDKLVGRDPAALQEVLFEAQANRGYRQGIFPRVADHLQHESTARTVAINIMLGAMKELLETASYAEFAARARSQVVEPAPKTSSFVRYRSAIASVIDSNKLEIGRSYTLLRNRQKEYGAIGSDPFTLVDPQDPGLEEFFRARTGKWERGLVIVRHGKNLFLVGAHDIEIKR